MTVPEDWLNAPIHCLDVWTHHLLQPVRVGRLNYEVDSGAGIFEWSEDARRANLNLSPASIPLADRIWNSASQRELPAEYQGLPGFLNDALPDGWGLYLMDQALAQAGVKASRITPAVRLAYLGNRAWGSLSFNPVIEDDSKFRRVRVTTGIPGLKNAPG